MIKNTCCVCCWCVNVTDLRLHWSLFVSFVSALVVCLDTAQTFCCFLHHNKIDFTCVSASHNKLNDLSRNNLLLLKYIVTVMPQSLFICTFQPELSLPFVYFYSLVNTHTHTFLYTYCTLRFVRYMWLLSGFVPTPMNWPLSSPQHTALPYSQ